MPARQPAPAPLRLVEEFVNTTDEEVEELTTPDTLAAWCLTHGLVAEGTTVDDAALGRAIAVREALRSLLLANNGQALDTGAAQTLNAFAQRAPLLMRFDGAGTAALTPDRVGIDGALARILVVVLASMADGTWQRLKTCRSETCGWVFYDSSKNHSAAWCSMRVCGNRQKARRYRRRQRETPASAGGAG